MLLSLVLIHIVMDAIDEDVVVDQSFLFVLIEVLVWVSQVIHHHVLFLLFIHYMEKGKILVALGLALLAIGSSAVE